MQNEPFRSAVGDVRLCLERLREADTLLDSVPRTEAAEKTAADSDRVTTAVILGGAVAGALVAASGHAGATATPTAAREFAEALALLRKVAAELGEHRAGAYLQQEVTRRNGLPLTPAAKALAAVVRDLHPKLREEFGLLDTPPLTNWSVNDAEDEAALQAAGLGWRTRAIKIALAIAALVALYAFVFSG